MCVRLCVSMYVSHAHMQPFRERDRDGKEGKTMEVRTIFTEFCSPRDKKDEKKCLVKYQCILLRVSII